MRRLSLGLVFLMPCSFMFVLAQSAPPPARSQDEVVQSEGALPVYDVSVFRPAALGENADRHIWTRLNTLDVKNTPLLSLLRSAFDVPEDMIVGLPEWAMHSRVDIEAKTLETDAVLLRNLTVEQRQEMMLALFEDRLTLKWHRETRVMPTYDLVVAGGGPKLKPTGATGHNSGVSVNDTRFKLTNVPVSELSVVLAEKLGRPVVDKTELTGRYDVALEWSSDLATPSSSPDAPPPLLTVVQEQLGLKLKSGKDPVQVIVIDRLTPPTPN